MKVLPAVKPTPLHVETRSVAVGRTAVLSRLKGVGIATLPQGVPVIAPPASPVRRTEMFGINLRILPIRAPQPVRVVPVRKLSRVTRPKATLTPAGGTLGAFANRVQVDADKVVRVGMNGGRILTGKAMYQGDQIVRSIFLAEGDEPLADRFVKGAQTVTLPTRCRQVFFIGDGTEAPVSNQIALESVGVEHDTLLLALGPKLFASFGCLVQMRGGEPLEAEELDTLPAYELLQRATTLRVHFPLVRPNWTLVISVTAIAPDPEPAMDEIRWLTAGATLSGLQIIVGPDQTAFVMTVDAKQQWALDIDVGVDWRVAGVAVCDDPAATVVARLRAGGEWDLVDDRFEKPPAGMTSTINLEVTQ